MPNNYVVGVECALQHNGKFLIIERPPGKHAEGLLAFPGGGLEIEDGSAPDALVQAAKREVFEEVGLSLEDPLKYIISSYFIDSKTNQPVIWVVFYCNLIKTKIDLKISEREVAAHYWWTPDEITAAKNCPEWLSRYLSLMKP